MGELFLLTCQRLCVYGLLNHTNLVESCSAADVARGNCGTRAEARRRNLAEEGAAEINLQEKR